MLAGSVVVAGVVATLSRDASAQVLPEPSLEETIRSAELNARPEPEPPGRTSAGRVALEFLGGFALGPTLAVGLAALTMLPRGEMEIVTLLPLGMIPVGGSPLGVWAVGRSLGGHGRYGLTMLGSGIGATVGSLIVFGTLSSRNRGERCDGGPSWCTTGTVAAWAAYLVLPVIGSVIAYEASDRGPRRPREVFAAQWAPIVQPLPGGALLGVTLSL